MILSSGGSSAVDLVNALSALIGVIGTTLATTVSVLSARALLRSNKQNPTGSSQKADGPPGATGGEKS